MRINFYGGPGCGKCFGKDTLILMYDGTTKPVQDVIVGDLVMGPDSKPRTVMSLARGREPLYRIQQKCWGGYKKKLHTVSHPYCANFYIVNESHILTMKKGGFFRKNEDIRRRSMSVYYESGKGRKQCSCGVFIARTALECPACKAVFGQYKKSKFEDHPSRDGKIYNISVRDYLKESSKFKQVMKGYRVAVDFPAQDVKIDPYFLGVWLGDGTTMSTSVTNIDPEIISVVYQEADRRGLDVRKSYNKNKTCPTYFIGVNRANRAELTEDSVVCYETWQYLRSQGLRGKIFRSEFVNLVSDKLLAMGWLGKTGFSGSEKKVRKVRRHIEESGSLPAQCERAPSYRFGNTLLNDMRHYDLIGNKHIPIQYLANSREVRLALLAGIVDTDGNLNGATSYEITTKSIILARDIVWLARSLGFYSNAKESWKRATNGSKEKKLYWRIMIGGNVGEIPVKISYKKTIFERTKYDPLVYRFAVDPLGEGDYYGFAVDCDHLFLLGDFTVVHNSTLAAKIYADLKANIELIHEYIKAWAYQKRVPKSYDQAYIFGKQMHAEDLVYQSGVEHLVTDSPLCLQPFYSKTYNFPGWTELMILAKKYESVQPSINILLDRTGIPYHQKGRYENADQAVERDVNLRKFLEEQCVPFVTFKTMDYDGILKYIDLNLTSWCSEAEEQVKKELKRKAKKPKYPVVEDYSKYDEGMS